MILRWCCDKCNKISEIEHTWAYDYEKTSDLIKDNHKCISSDCEYDSMAIQFLSLEKENG